MSSTVTFGSMEVSSNVDSGQAIADVLAQKDDSPSTPKILVDKGQPVEEGPDDETSKAAATLGKASAAKRAAAKEDVDESGSDAGSESADEADVSAGASEQPPEAKPLGKPRHDPRARVQEATREAKEARERADSLQAERDRLARELEAARQPPQQQQGLVKPRKQDFPNEEEYLDARDTFNRALWSAQSRQEEMQRSWQAHLQVSASNLTKSIVEGSKQDYRTFMETIAPEIREAVPASLLENPDEGTGENFLADHLYRFPETAHQLMRYLTDNPQELQRIAALQSPRATTRELAKLEARLEAAPTATSSRQTVSKANPPVRPVTGSPNVGRDSDELDEDAPLSARVRAFGQRELKSGR